MSKFTHLHVHTEYSLLDGVSKIKKLVKRAKELGMDSLAITDHGNMYGAIEFYKECKSEGIKPIIGCEMYIAPRSHTSKEGKLDTEPFHLTVIAKDNQGYKNLMKLVSISWTDGYYYKPRIDKELIKQYHEGLIALSACPAGEFVRGLESGGLEIGEKVAKEYLEIFGEGNYYFELQNHHWEKHMSSSPHREIQQEGEKMQKLQDMTIKSALILSKKLGIPVVATKDLHYIKREDAEAHDAVLCVQTGKSVSDIKRLRMVDTPEFYLKSPEEMLEDFKDIPEACENSVKIADMCNLEIDLVKAIFPHFSSPESKSSMDYLRELAFKGAREKLEITDEVQKRLNYELDIIDNKKLEDYFLVVADFIEWSHTRGIITNTRGSAAGSLVLYCLGVTNLNPLDYLLPFERFLTKDRPYMPDIDADLADDRRDEVIHYLMEKYGADKVAHIVTFGTMQGRAAIRDIGRVLDIPYSEVDKIAKLVPPPKQGFHTTLEEHLKQVPELQEIYKSNPTYKKLLDLACQIEDTVRHASVHAAGILIAPEDIRTFTPIQRDTNSDKIVSQYDMYSVVDEYGGLGLVKMDLLGIRNLSILGRAVEYVEKNRGVRVDLNKIALDDQKTYEMLARGETMGVFQLSSDGMTKWLVELRPKKITDLSAMVALYRPGPMGSIPDYIERARDPSKIKYFDPRMESFMSQSLGILVYQEDVLYTAIHIAGYPWDKADKFRKAMGKKKPEEMEKQKVGFIQGCVDNGMTQKRAEELFALIAPFAAYGFGKAHAASYAMVSYQTAYMKANYPVEYMAAIMTAEYGDGEKIAHAIEECKRMGIMVSPPDVNRSEVGFTIEEVSSLSEADLKRQISKGGKGENITQGIRFGLSAIKNVGLLAIESIINSRKTKPFNSLADICSRVDTRLVNKKALESLIKAGSLDTFGSRASQLMILEQCLDEAHKANKHANNGQFSLFGEEEAQIVSIRVDLPDVEEMPLEKLLEAEKDLLGFYLHEPPYLNALTKLAPYTNNKIASFTDEQVGKKAKIGGVIVESKKVVTKKSGAEMAFVKLFDGISEVECVVFPKTYTDCKEFLVSEKVVLVEGKIEKREDKFSIIVDTIEEFNPDTAQIYALPENLEQKVEIQVPKDADGELLKKINSTLRQFPGESSIFILLPTNGSYKKMSLGFKVDPDGELFSSMENLLGPNSIRLS